MKHKYNTTLILSVFPPSPLSNTMSNTANNYTLNACETKDIQKVKKISISHELCPPTLNVPAQKRNESTQQYAEMCSKNTITNFAKNSKQKKSKAQQMYKMTDTKFLEKKFSENNSKKKILSKDGKRKLPKQPKLKQWNYSQCRLKF